MNADELVTAYTTNNPLQAEIVKNFLVDEGIPCEISGEGQTGLAGVLEIQLLVKSGNLEQARDLIAEHEAAAPDWEGEGFDMREEE